jgi:hypothetical protein
MAVSEIRIGTITNLTFRYIETCNDWITSLHRTGRALFHASAFEPQNKEQPCAIPIGVCEAGGNEVIASASHPMGVSKQIQPPLANVDPVKSAPPPSTSIWSKAFYPKRRHIHNPLNSPNEVWVIRFTEANCVSFWPVIKGGRDRGG